VKRLSPSIPEVSQFENEAHHLMKLNHPNIVPLVAYCFESKIVYVEQEGRYFWAEKPERLLCLEYMPNGSLHDYLSGMTIHTGVYCLFIYFFEIVASVVRASYTHSI